MTKNRTIKNCDFCSNEDSISCISGLCPSCEEDIKRAEILKEFDLSIYHQSDPLGFWSIFKENFFKFMPFFIGLSITLIIIELIKRLS